MFAKLPQRERDILLAYCEGVNDTIDAVYAGALPEPIEVDAPAQLLGFGDDLFGNATNISDQVDPYYRAPGGDDPERPNARLPVHARDGDGDRASSRCATSASSSFDEDRAPRRAAGADREARRRRRHRRSGATSTSSTTRWRR